MAKKKLKKEDVSSASGIVDAELVQDFVPDLQPVVVSQSQKLEISSDEHRSRILKLWENIKENYMEIGMLLAHAQTERRYESWGYSTFKDYAQRELGVKYTKAKYLADVWRHLSRSDEVLKKVSNVGWDKMKTLTHVVTEDNVDNWVEKAKHLSADELKKEVKTFMMAQVPDDSKKALEGEQSVQESVKDATKSITYQFSYEDYLVVCQAIEKIKESNPEIQSNSQCLALACADFLASGSFGSSSEESFYKILSRYEGLLGVRIAVWKPSTNEVPYGAEMIRDMVQGASGA